MKNINEIKMIENLNLEFISLYHSNDVRLMRNFHRLKNLNLKDISRLVKKKITASIGDKKIKKNIIPRKEQDFFYNFGNPMENIKVAVYTCITKNYDVPKPPIYIEKDTKYFLFTDNLEKKYTIWENKKIDCKNYENDANRFYKFHPNLFKSDYDFAIYIDGNVKVVSDVTTLCSIARESKTGIAMHRHHERDCIYEEGLACKYYKRGNIDKINIALDKMKDDGFPRRFGLCEATIIVYDLKNINSIKLANEWWNLYHKSEAKRDQIFFPYLLWKNGYTMDDVGNLGNDLWKNPKFVIYGHK